MAPYAAKKYVASSPQAEIIGSVLLGFMDNLRADDIRPLLAEYGLDTIDPKRWYPQQLILDFYRALAEEKVNSTESMVALGVKAIENVPTNPNVRTLDQAVQALEAISQSIQRNVPESEGFHVAGSQPGRMMVIANTPYPDEVIFGYLWATAKRYRPGRANFAVRQVENAYAGDYPGTLKSPRQDERRASLDRKPLRRRSKITPILVLISDPGQISGNTKGRPCLQTIQGRPRFLCWRCGAEPDR